MPTGSITPSNVFLYVSPFVSRNDGILASPSLTNGGRGYTSAFVEGTVTGTTGSNGRVVLTVDTASGQGVGMFVFTRGQDYVNPTVTFPTPAGGASASGVVYANQDQAVLGFTAVENSLLSYCQANAINSLILYDLNFLEWSNTGYGSTAAPGRSMLKDFITRAKTTYGLSHVSAARGFGSTAQANTKFTEVLDYNVWCQANGFSQGRIDSVTTEVEWWSGSPEISIADVRRSLARAYAIYTPSSTGVSSRVGINVYLGKGPNYSSSDPAQLYPYVDRWFVSTYKSTSQALIPGTLYTDTRGATGGLYRMYDIAQAQLAGTAQVYPIFSAESKLNPYNRNGGFDGQSYTYVDPDTSEDFMGTYFSTLSASTGPVPPRRTTPPALNYVSAWGEWMGLTGRASIYPPVRALDASWSTETDSSILQRVSPGGVAIFYSSLYRAGSPPTVGAISAVTGPGSFTGPRALSVIPKSAIIGLPGGTAVVLAYTGSSYYSNSQRNPYASEVEASWVEYYDYSQVSQLAEALWGDYTNLDPEGEEYSDRLSLFAELVRAERQMGAMEYLWQPNANPAGLKPAAYLPGWDVDLPSTFNPSVPPAYSDPESTGETALGLTAVIGYSPILMEIPYGPYTGVTALALANPWWTNPTTWGPTGYYGGFTGKSGTTGDAQTINPADFYDQSSQMMKWQLGLLPTIFADPTELNAALAAAEVTGPVYISQGSTGRRFLDLPFTNSEIDAYINPWPWATGPAAIPFSYGYTAGQTGA